MLVLTRHVKQVINIGDDIEIVVVSLSDGRVRLGIRAPGDVRILRGELCKGQKSNGRKPVSV